MLTTNELRQHGIHSDDGSDRIGNLLKLAVYLLNYNDSRFGMAFFGKECGSVPCGTSACAVGHGVLAGIPKLPSEKWFAYSHRCFISAEHLTWDWCFSGRWDQIDNTPHGAGQRILYLLENGLDHLFGLSEEFEVFDDLLTTFEPETLPYKDMRLEDVCSG